MGTFLLGIFLLVVSSYGTFRKQKRMSVPNPRSAEYLVLLVTVTEGGQLHLEYGLCGAIKGHQHWLWGLKRRKLWSASFRPDDLNGWGSANRKYLLGWRDSTQFLRQDAGPGSRVCCESLALLLQGWHWVCTIVRFTQTRIEGAEASHWPECFLSSQGVFTERWCFSKPLIRSTPRPPYLYFSKCVEGTHCFCFFASLPKHSCHYKLHGILRADNMSRTLCCNDFQTRKVWP